MWNYCVGVALGWAQLEHCHLSHNCCCCCSTADHRSLECDYMSMAYCTSYEFFVLCYQSREQELTLLHRNKHRNTRARDLNIILVNPAVRATRQLLTMTNENELRNSQHTKFLLDSVSPTPLLMSTWALLSHSTHEKKKLKNALQSSLLWLVSLSRSDDCLILRITFSIASFFLFCCFVSRTKTYTFAHRESGIKCWNILCEAAAFMSNMDVRGI